MKRGLYASPRNGVPLLSCLRATLLAAAPPPPSLPPSQCSDLSYNAFTGALPNSLSNLSSLFNL